MENGILVVGLGNPGPEYAGNRHNFGFMVLDALAWHIDAPSFQEKFKGLFARGRHGGRRVDLLKPMTFMNLSGRSVAKAAGFFQIAVENIIVIHDELDLPFGTLRLKKGGGTGGHKGIASIKENLGSADFTRVRMGIGRPIPEDPRHDIDITNYVLRNFESKDVPSLTNVIEYGVKAVERVVQNGIRVAMNEFNKRGGGSDEP